MSNLRGLIDLHEHYVTGGQARHNDDFLEKTGSRDGLAHRVMSNQLKGKDLTQTLRTRLGLERSDDLHKVLENVKIRQNRNISAPFNKFFGLPDDLSDKEFRDELHDQAHKEFLEKGIKQNYKKRDAAMLEDAYNRSGKPYVPSERQIGQQEQQGLESIPEDGDESYSGSNDGSYDESEQYIRPVSRTNQWKSRDRGCAVDSFFH